MNSRFASIVSMTIVFVASFALHAEAGKKKNKSGKLTTWKVSVSDQDAGSEWRRVVEGATGKRYSSGMVEPAGKNAIFTATHLERDAKGYITKYRRKQQVRLGKGLFAFRSSGSLRIKGVNQSFPMADLEGAARHLVWDAKAWHTLADWAPKLGAAQEPVDLRYVDLARRTMGKVTAAPGEPIPLTDAKGKRAAVAAWTLPGLTAESMTLFVSSRGSLVGAQAGFRKMLREGWSWEVEETPPPAPEAAGAKAGAAVPGGEPAKPGQPDGSNAAPPENPGEIGAGP